MDWVIIILPGGFDCSMHMVKRGESVRPRTVRGKPDRGVVDLWRSALVISRQNSNQKASPSLVIPTVVCKDTYQKSPYSSSFHHADSRDSHPSRYESHRTPRYSSDPDKEMEFPAHLEVVRLLVTQSMSVVLLYGIIISTEKRLS